MDTHTLQNRRSIHLHLLGTNLIDLTNHDLLHLRMFQDFTDDPTVSTTDDQHLFRLGMAEHRDVGEHLVIRDLILLRALDHTIDHEDIPEGFTLEDLDVLCRATDGRDKKKNAKKKKKMRRRERKGKQSG